MEVAVRLALPARELGKMMGTKGGDVERVMRETFENGISVEAEFAFTKGVAEYCKEAVREGTFRGGYKLNLKDQMEWIMAAMFRRGGKPGVLMVGGDRWEKLKRKWEGNGGRCGDEGLDGDQGGVE
jgi:hypothetical protein